MGDAIESVLAQTHSDVEIVIVDDGSRDGTLEVAQAYSDAHAGKVRVFEQKNAGACAARNYALSESKGVYVKFLDADDVMMPDALEVQLRAVLDAPPSDYVVPYGDLLITDVNLQTRQRRPKTHDIGADSPDLVDRVVAVLSNNIQTSLPLHRRERLVEVGGFRSHLLRAQEYDLHLRLVLAGARFVHVPHVVTHLRHHSSPDRLSNTSPMRKDPGYHLGVVRERRETIEGVLGRPLPDSVAEVLARSTWSQMRRLIQTGQSEWTERYDFEARKLDPEMRHAGSLFRKLSKLIGPIWAEHFLVRARRLAALARRAVP